MISSANLFFEIGDVISHPKFGRMVVVIAYIDDETERKNKFLLKSLGSSDFYYHTPYYGLYVEKKFIVQNMGEVA